MATVLLINVRIHIAMIDLCFWVIFFWHLAGICEQVICFALKAADEGLTDSFKGFHEFNSVKLRRYWLIDQLQAAVLVFFTQSNLGKKRSELKHLIKERAKKLEEIKQSIKVIKVSRWKTSRSHLWVQTVWMCVIRAQATKALKRIQPVWVTMHTVSIWSLIVARNKRTWYLKHMLIAGKASWHASSFYRA